MAERDPFYTNHGEEWTGDDLSQLSGTRQPLPDSDGNGDLGEISHAARLGIVKTENNNSELSFKPYVVRPSYHFDSDMPYEEQENIRIARMTRKQRECNGWSDITAQADLSSEQPSS